MKGNSKFGVIPAILGVITGSLTFYFMADISSPTIAGKLAGGRPDEAAGILLLPGTQNLILGNEKNES